MAALVFAAGRCLAKRSCYAFCLFIAGAECLFMPLGTALGIFTLVVMTRESVKTSFVGQAEENDLDGAN